MRDEALKSKVPAWGWAALAGIGAAYVLSICVLLFLIWDLRRNVDLMTDRLPSAMLAFERSIGYAGLIHNFKNHVLRTEEERYGPAALADRATAIQALDEVERLAAEAGLRIRTNEIRATLDRYAEWIDEVDSLHAQGLPVPERDARVRLADIQALEDLRAAQGEIDEAFARAIENRRIKIAAISVLILLLPAAALTTLELRRREERGYIARIEALNADFDRQNEKLAASNHALSVTNAELNEFAHAAAHDLRTPLRGISHEAGYLVQDFSDKVDREVIERLLHIQALCARLDTVMMLLLRYARLAPPVQVDMVDPMSVIEEIEVGIGPRLTSARGTITVETELPLVACKRFDLGTIFQNLFENALTYNRSADKEIVVGFLPQEDIGGRVFREVFYVRDNGIGIPPEYHVDVFRMFKRLHHDDAYGPGAGAGLCFVKKVVGNYGGMVQLASEPGVGTTVYFSFTRQVTDREHQADRRSPLPDRLQAVGV